MGQSLGITASYNQAPALSASQASTYVRFKDKYDKGKFVSSRSVTKPVLASEKRIQCHIQATNKFPTKLGLIIERATMTSRTNSENSRLKTIANPK